jgi:CubicO group peptidase (beta-lactamase class C family)
MHDVMAGHVERGEVPGLVTLVGRRGEACIEAIGVQASGRRDPMRRDTIFRIASMTKPIAAVAAMILVEECHLRLDEPVDRWLPELAGRTVLKRLDGPLDDTVPAKRPLSLRDLLTLRMGLGYVMDAASPYPILKAANERKLLLGPPRPQSLPAPDEWIRSVATLPLMYQPGERWMYDVGLDVLGVLIARAAGQPLEAFLRAPLRPARHEGYRFQRARREDRPAGHELLDQSRTRGGRGLRRGPGRPLESPARVPGRGQWSGLDRR